MDELLEQELGSGDYDDDSPQIGARRGAGRRRGPIDPDSLPRLFCGIKPVVVPAGQTRTVQVQVTNPFRPEKLILHPASQALFVEDIKISRVSQNTGDGPVPGYAFSADSVGTNLRGDTAQTGVGIELTVSNPNTTEGGAITLYGVFWGPAA
jgi:hypothetical protein